MKSYKIYTVVFLIIFTVSGCEDKLELAPVSELSQAAFYENETDFVLGINAAYNGLRGQFDDIVLYGDIRSDNSRGNRSGSVTTRSNFDEFSLNSSNSSIGGRWTNSYRTLAGINAILDKIDAADIDSDSRDQIRGEALFIRGVIYFNLGRIYGNVPLVLTEITADEAATTGQSTQDQVLGQAVTDLTAAASLLPPAFDGDDVGRATSIASNAMISKVQLTRGNFSEATTALRAVVAEEGVNVDLLDNYADVFDIRNEYNAEIIFAVRWTDDGVNGNGFNFRYANENEPDNRATSDLYNEYETNDMRRDFTLNTTANITDTLVFKYGFAESGMGESDWPVVRYADILLMLAEALNEQGFVAGGEAFDLVNRVRTRAGLAAITSASVADQDAFRLAVEHERRVELASEGHRWFDLVRTGRYVDVMSAKGFNTQAHHNLFPIPLREIENINNGSILSQNPGYN